MESEAEHKIETLSLHVAETTKASEGHRSVREKHGTEDIRLSQVNPTSQAAEQGGGNAEGPRVTRESHFPGTSAGGWGGVPKLTKNYGKHATKTGVLVARSSGVQGSGGHAQSKKEKREAAKAAKGQET